MSVQSSANPGTASSGEGDLRANWERISRALQLRSKRFFDLTVAMAALVILSPLFVIVSVLIKYDSPGRVFFRQPRWGKDNAIIHVYKFRSMASNVCDVSGVTQTVEGDPRVTRIGKFLRRANLDELPQLFNVLRGDMSLVGPRCHAVGMRAAGRLYEELVPNYHQRHQMRPGITGLAQMRGFRGPTDTAFKSRVRVAFDLHYVENFSFALDLKIIIGTIKSELINGSGF